MTPLKVSERRALEFLAREISGGTAEVFYVRPFFEGRTFLFV